MHHVCSIPDAFEWDITLAYFFRLGEAKPVKPWSTSTRTSKTKLINSSEGPFAVFVFHYRPLGRHDLSCSGPPAYSITRCIRSRLQPSCKRRGSRRSLGESRVQGRQDQQKSLRLTTLTTKTLSPAGDQDRESGLVSQHKTMVQTSSQSSCLAQTANRRTWTC